MHGIKPSDEEEVEQDHDIKANNNSANQAKNNQNSTANPPKNDKKELVLYLQKILKSGACFGEIGLICNKSRTGTITCSEDSHFAVMEKQDFVAILKPVEEKKLQKQTEFLGSLPCFNGWPFHFLRDVYLNISKRTLNRGDYIFREGDKSTFVAIVTKGKFCVYKEFVVQKPIVTEDKGTNVQTTFSSDRASKKKKQEIIPKLPFNVNESSLKQKNEVKKLLELGDKDLVGEEDVIKNRKRQYSIKCESPEGGEIIVITKQVFRERMLSREIAQRTIFSRIPLKEQIFADHVGRVEYNLQNFKKLLRENRAELKNDKLKEQRLLQEQEEYYKKYFSNLGGSEGVSKDNSFEVISSNNKVVDRSEVFLKNLDIVGGNLGSEQQQNELGTFNSMNASAIYNQQQNPSQLKRRQSASTPIKQHPSNPRGSQSPAKSPRQQSRNSPREERNRFEQSQSPIQLIDQNAYSHLIEKTNEIVNKQNEKKYGATLNQQASIDDEADSLGGSKLYKISAYNRKNLMMDEKGNGIPLINPMKNEEDLDRQVRKHLQMQPKRKNYLGEWRNGVSQMDKVYGILRNAGYFDQKIVEIKEIKLKRKGSPSDLSTPQSESARHNNKKLSLQREYETPNKTQYEYNQKITIKEIQSIEEDTLNQQSIQQVKEPRSSLIEEDQNELKKEVNNMMDYYLNQSHLYSIAKNEEAYNQKRQEVIGNKVVQSQISNTIPTIPLTDKKNIPNLRLNNGKYSLQNSPNRYSGGASIKSGDEGSSANYPLKKNGINGWQNQNKQQFSTLSQFYLQQNVNQHQVLTYRDNPNSARRQIANNSQMAGYQSARNYESRATSRGYKENSPSPISQSYSQNPQNSSRQQSRQNQRSPSQLLQELQRPLTRNQILKSQTPIDYGHRNASVLLEGFKEYLPKPFREFNPTHKPLTMNQDLKDELEMSTQDPYFSKSSGSSYGNGQTNRYKVKQTISQFMNRHTQKQRLVITDDTTKSIENNINKSLVSDDLIDYSKLYLNKIKKQGNKSRDLSFNANQRSYF